VNDKNESDVSEKRPYLKRMRSVHNATTRRSLPHDHLAATVFRSVQYYYEKHFWSVPILLLMPDHLHMLAKFSPEVGMKKLIRNWKRYLANESGIVWQRDFFDHCLRGDESLSNKATYILQNPVRAGLVDQSEDWPYQFRLV